MGGLIGIKELESGHIDHALAMAIPHAATGVVAFPAQRSDGNEHTPGEIPEGTRFRLDPRSQRRRVACCRPSFASWPRRHSATG